MTPVEFLGTKAADPEGQQASRAKGPFLTQAAAPKPPYQGTSLLSKAFS